MSQARLAHRRLRSPQVVAALGAVLLLAGAGCGAPASRHEVRSSGEALGTTWSVKWVSHARMAAVGSDDWRASPPSWRASNRRDIDLGERTPELAGFRPPRWTRSLSSPPRPSVIVAARRGCAADEQRLRPVRSGPLVALSSNNAALEDQPEQELKQQRPGSLAAADLEIEGRSVFARYQACGLVISVNRQGIRGRYHGAQAAARAYQNFPGEDRRQDAPLGTTPSKPCDVGIQDPTARGDDLEAVLACGGSLAATTQPAHHGGQARHHVIDPRDRPAARRWRRLGRVVGADLHRGRRRRHGANGLGRISAWPR